MRGKRYLSSVKNPLVKECPCAKNHQSCGYVVIGHILGCPYNCSYCYLHSFYGKDEIVIVDNEEQVLVETKQYLSSTNKKLRIGTGEYSDSLAISEAANLGKKLVKLFAGQEKDLLELKTKSVNISGLFGLEHRRRTVVGWSVNPEKIARNEESDAPTLSKRLQAAKECAREGYLISFHLDPIIYYGKWKTGYGILIEKIFEAVDPAQIAWISLGALRFPLKQKEIMQNIFQSLIDFSLLRQGEDKKLRYPKSLRVDLFGAIAETIRQNAPEVYAYLCMEEESVFDQLAGLLQKGKYGDYFHWTAV